MPVAHSSGRPATSVRSDETAALMVGDRRPNPIMAMQTWSALKARQILEDGTSARIEDDRAHRLTLLRLRHPECWAPAPRAFEHRTVAEAVAAAQPAIRAAVARHTPQGSAS
ncbi:hypothetical protein [Sagittula sp. MA-2]|jgi:hypothetical protein|uniref:hypothetical protein n=1 Tax=Sagittula sp. MA-2 TaxID=3048007 RepID=UPI0024C3D162|nr:hypothetical protein [Sagittula sp. MA-2]WHZ33433.1 hypothetical protein QNI11_12295 [Sagittula sp. MA-2]